MFTFCSPSILVSNALSPAEVQMANGRDFLLETPFHDNILNNSHIVNLTEDFRVNVAKGDMCAHGLKCDGQRVKRSTWWLSSSSEIVESLERKCSQRKNVAG